jgi:hypothetical protein
VVGADSDHCCGVVAVSRYRARFYDPTDNRHGGMPTWPWRCAPAHLLTRRQLAARGLRPAGQPICGQVLWSRRGKTAVAYLYDVEQAKPKRHPSARQRVALGKAPRGAADLADLRPRRRVLHPTLARRMRRLPRHRDGPHPRSSSMTARTAAPVGVCLDCAAHLHVDELTGQLVDHWGQAICGASYRAHVPDLPSVTAGPAAPATSPPDRLRRTDLSQGPGRYQTRSPASSRPAQDRFQPLRQERSAETILRSRLDPGHPAGPAPDALRAGSEEHAPARP